MSTKASCTNCDVTSYCDIKNKEIYIFHYTTLPKKSFLVNLLDCNFVIDVITM